MKEQEIIELGMVRNDVSAEESGDGAFYYYTWEPYEGSLFALISCESDDESVTKHGEWVVYVFEDEKVRFWDASEARVLIGVMSRNTKKK